MKKRLLQDVCDGIVCIEAVAKENVDKRVEHQKTVVCAYRNAMDKLKNDKE